MEKDLSQLLNNSQVVKLKLSQLISDPGNSRVHDIHNIQVIKKSLMKFGQYRPFVVQKSTMYIRVGNGMYQAMIQLAKQQGKNVGDIEVNCMVLDLSDQQANTLSVLDNKSSDLSYNDNAKLGELFKNMSQQNIQLSGFSNQQVSKILQSFNTDIQKMINPLDNVKTQQQKKQQKQVKKGILQYKLLFENQEQKEVWQKFVNRIKQFYGQSVCESLKMFIVDYYKDSENQI